MAVKLKFDAVVQSLLPSAADVLLNPIPAFGKQVLRFPHQFWYSARRA